MILKAPAPVISLPSPLALPTPPGQVIGPSGPTDMAQSSYVSPATPLAGGTPDGGGGRTTLSSVLYHLWETLSNRPIRDDDDFLPRVRAFISPASIPRTMAMAKAILDHIAQERQIEVNDISVIVHGPMLNLIELIVWLELGARVTVLENSRFEFRHFKDALNLMPGFCDRYPRLTIMPLGAPPAESADIVVWTHPCGTENFELKPFQLGTHLKKDGILIVQSDLDYIYIDCFGDPRMQQFYRRLFLANINNRSYFMPSHNVGNGGQVVILKKL